MATVDSAGVLDVFSITRDIILADSVLSLKFKKDNVLQFEPKHKSSYFKGFPYFWINIPQSPQEKLVFDNSLTSREWNVPVIMRLDYSARDKTVSYANAFIKAIEDNEASFQSDGFMDVMVSLIDLNPSQVVDDFEVVEAEFELSLKGAVGRG